MSQSYNAMTRRELSEQIRELRETGLETVQRSQFGRTLQALRKAREWTIREFAEKHGCTHQAVTILELHVKSPTIATAEGVCKTLGITITEFFVEYEKHKINLADKIAAKLAQ